MNLRRLIYAFFLPAALLAVGQARAQYGNPGYYYQANKLFDNKAYYEAAQAYEKFLQSEKKSKARGTAFAVEKKTKGKANLNPHEESVYHLAECYRQLHDFVQAEKWYKIATGFSQTAYPAARYWYGICLRANQKYDEAYAQIFKFTEEYTALDPLLQGADKELENLKFIQAQLHKAQQQEFELHRYDAKPMTSAYAMSLRGDEALVFTAIQAIPPISGKDREKFVNNLFQTGSEPSSGQILDLPSEADTHQGLSSFTRDGQRIFFTRWTSVNGKSISAIYTSEYNGKSWSDPVRMDALVNLPGYSSGQPFITADNKILLFASDRPGGQGGYDLWYASLDNSFQVITVENMGPGINTPGDEEAPFYHASSRTLLFSSNGRIGMGGFDIYYSHNDFSFSHWDAPVDPGMPINSSKDDMYYISVDEDNVWNKGWLSSDRESSCCLALYSISANSLNVVRGEIRDCGTGSPIANATITVADARHKDQIMQTLQADSLGRYRFDLRNISRFVIKASKDGYLSQDNLYRVQVNPGVDTVQNGVLCLQVTGETEEHKKIKGMLSDLSKATNLGNFAYGKATLTSATNSNLDSLANLMKQHPHLIVQIAGYTDGNGTVEYNLKLSEKRVQTCIHYLVKKGIDPMRLVGKAMGKCCPVEPDTIDGKDNPSGREKNRRVEFSLLRGDE